MSKINQQIITAENKVKVVRDKVAVTGSENFKELKNYYVNKPWKQVQDLPTHLPFSEEYQ